ncbi:MAG: nicotinate-nucleotide adenylyltransferase [Dehalococcoidia bacterium]
MKLGVMGGTFDPIHIGHLILAETARQQLQLDKVRFVVAGDPWRKAGRDISPAQQRLAMTWMATQGNDAFEVDDCEIRREGPTYTSVTLQEIRAALGPHDEIYFLAGEDSLAELPHWHDPASIWEQALIVVAPREGFEASDTIVPADRLVRLDMPYIGISSTRLRAMAQSGLSLRYQVPEAVEAYIAKQGLYRA